MTVREALDLFEAQLKRTVQASGLKIKVVRSPLAVREPGLTLRILPRKVLPGERTQAERSRGSKAILVALLLSSRIESIASMERFLDASEFLVEQSFSMNRLQDTSGQPIADHRLVWSTGAEDAVFEDPVDDTLVWAREEWRVKIYLS